MAKFSVGREDDSEGPSSPRPKKQRTTPQPPPPPQQQLYRRCDQPVVEEEEEEEEEEGESEYDDDDEEVDDEEDDDDQNEGERSHAGQPQPPSNRVSVGPSGDGSISVTLTDPDVLDCPICLEPLSIPVFQCENDHVACSSRCIKRGNKCPSCK